MFKNSVLFAVLSIAFTISALSAAAQDNSRIDRQIRHEILTLPYYGVFDAIGYTRNGNAVTLNGYVVRPTTKRDAEDSVADIDGVGRVINNIEVLPPSPSDDRIRRRLFQRLSNGGALYRYFLGTNPSIRLIVKGGRVILEGYVDRKADADLANILARGVSGTFGVTNNLKVIAEPR